MALLDIFKATKKVINPNIERASDLLVIEMPYFKKTIEGEEDKCRLAFMVARRSSAQEPWKIERQKYTRTTFENHVSGTDFVHGPTTTAYGDQDVIRAFYDFAEECHEDGMTKHVHDKQSYVYGLLLADAVPFLELEKPEEVTKIASKSGFRFTP